MPELSDKPFRAQVVSDRVSLPSMPEYPADVLRRFPSMQEFMEEDQSWWNRVRKILYQTYEEQQFEVNNHRAGYLSLVETVGKNTASIIQEAKVRADEDSALSTRIDNLSSSIGGEARNVFAQPDEPDPELVDLFDGDLWFDTDDNNIPYRWNATLLLWVPLPDGRIEGIVSAITTIQTTYATKEYAEAKKSEAIAAAGTYTDTETAALASAITTAYSSADSALSSRVTSLESSIDTATTGLLARVSVIESTYASEDFAEAKRDEAISAASDDATAKVASEASARATEDAALSARIDLVSATNVRTNISAQPAAPTGPGVVEGDLWFDSDDNFKQYRYNGSTWVSVSDARISANASAIATISSTMATDSEVTAAVNSAVIAAAADATAKVLTESTARATADGYMEGKYTLGVVAGNVVTGMVITSASAPNGGTVGNVMFQADRFQIYNGSVGRVMFDVSSSQVRLGGTLVVDTPNGRVFVGTGTYANSNTPFYVDKDGNFSLKTGLTWSPATNSLGINANAGSAGGWTINPTTISASNVVLNSNGSLVLGTANDVLVLTASDPTYRMWAGNATSGSASFSVTKSGLLTASGAVITGTIYATGGVVDGSLITTGTITGSKIAASTISLSNLNFTVVASSNIIAAINASSEGITIQANKVRIGATTVFESSSYNPAAKVTLGSAANDVNTNSTTISGNKIRSGLLESNNWTSTTGSQIDLTNGTIRLGGYLSPAFSVSATGALWATGATISGDITATSGTFTGSVTGATITGGTVSIGTGANQTQITSSGLWVGNIRLDGDTSQNSIRIGGSYPVFLSGGVAGAVITLGLSSSPDRVSIYGAGGGIVFGVDTNLYRSAANLLRTDDDFIANTLTTGNYVSAKQVYLTATSGAELACRGPGGGYNEFSWIHGNSVNVQGVNFRVFDAAGNQRMRVNNVTGDIILAAGAGLYIGGVLKVS